MYIEHSFTLIEHSLHFLTPNKGKHTMKNITSIKCAFVSILIVVFAVNLFGQDKEINRPKPSKVGGVDSFVNAVFNAYGESLAISTAINFIQFEILEIEDQGDGVTTEMVITNGAGEDVTKEGALLQFGELLVRATLQAKNIEQIKDTQEGATNSIKSAKGLKKVKATAAMVPAGKALVYTLSESLKQVELINQQISSIKAHQNN